MKKKAISLALAFVMAFSSASQAFAHEHTTIEDASASTKTSNLKASIVFSYPESINNIDNKGIQVKLNDAKGAVIGTLELTSSSLNSTSPIMIGNYTVTLNPVITLPENLLTEVELEFTGLARDQYTLTFSGNGHKTYTTDKIDLTKANKKVSIQTNNSTFTIGDVNGDSLVNSSDVAVLEQKINEVSSDRQYDLNGDGVININDIAFINHNTEDGEVVISYEYFTDEIIDTSQSKILLQEAGVTLDGDIADLASGAGVVTFSKETEISEDAPLEIPLVFEEAIEMDTIEIDGGISNGYVTVEDEDRNEIIVPIEAVSPLLRSSEPITVSLGTKVAVKKVTISVTAVSNEDGGTNYVSVQEVRFLQDIGQDEAGNQVVVVKGLTAVAGDSKVTLSWKEVDNITGYKVYYGESPTNLNKVIQTDKTTITIDENIDELENLKTYYFCVSAISDGYESEKSSIISATPEPSSVPSAPDFLQVDSEQDRTLSLSWGKTKNALSYNVYIKKQAETEFKLHASGLTDTSITISGLENDEAYDIYVTAFNKIGESKPSLTVTGTPKVSEIIEPDVPTKNRMDNSNILSIEMGHEHNYATDLYPDGFDPNWVIDEDYTTSWVARAYWESNSFIVTFDELMDMDYIVWVARLDEEKWRQVFGRYTLEFWYEGDDLSGPSSYTYHSESIRYNANETGYLILDFDKQENVKKVSVKTALWDGARNNPNASEIIFYHYDSIADEIGELFANSSFTSLASGVTEAQIDALVERVNDTTGFVVDSEILLQELEMARGLLKGDNSVLGVIKDNVYSINSEKDSKNYGASINNFQPLGVVGLANEKVVVYAEIPEGETVQLIPTQFYEEAKYLSGTPITLRNGRNIITIPKIGSRSNDRGGSLYVTYNGDKADEIKLHVLGAIKIPYLELRDLNEISKEVASERIRQFVTELTAFVPTLTGTLTLRNTNHTEISLPNVLLSLPADQILAGIKLNASTIEEQVEKVYNSALAWEELIKVVYKNYGIDDYINNGLETRQNIRYMRMFAGAFMYASGNHIGIEYGSVAALMNGSPVANLAEDATQNELYGWGIAHEVGHVMDRLGRAEVTNNIYSLMVQTYDGKDNTLLSRLEIYDIYDDIYEKVSLIREGLPNNVFTLLGMYWQLHLAYDNGGENSFGFYNQVYKKYRENADNIKDLVDMDKFAVVASEVAQKDLTEFFTRWGVSLSDVAKQAIQNLGLSKETRAIYYLNDESRRQRLLNNDGAITATITASAKVNEEDEKQVDITITPTKEDSNILGYEIIRNKTSIGFTTTNTYTDIIGSANNLAFEYSIVPISILGERQAEIQAGEIRIEYDKVVDPSLYNVEVVDNTLTATFNSEQVVSGIILKAKDGSTLPTTGTLTVEIKTKVDDVVDESYTTAKSIDFATTESLSKDSSKFLTYFNKPNVASTDTRIWNYDAIEIKVELENIEDFDISFISYPGDNIEFNDIAFGKLAKDYVYGDEEDDVIKAGTLIVVGSYRGDPIYNTMRIQGRFLEASGLTEEYSVVERDINGYSLFFADVLENEVSTTISDGIFIFVPDVQAEAELQGTSCDFVSILPSQIKAVLYRSDDPYGTLNNRVTSNTIWITTPDVDTMPTIVIE